MPLSPSLSRIAPRIASWLFSVGAVGLGYWGISWFIGVDTLAPLRLASVPPQNEGVSIKDFVLRSFDAKNKEVVYALVGKARVTKDRSLVYLDEVKDGRFVTDKGDVIRFTTKSAVYSPYSKAISSDQATRLKGKDMDLRTAGFNYDDTAKLITVPGIVKGGLGGGSVTTQGVTIVTTSGVVRTGPVSWEGQVEGAGSKGKTFWHFTTTKPVLWQGDEMDTEDATASSTDTIVKGHKIHWDRKADVMTVTGNVKYFGTDANMTCDKAVIYHKEKRAVLTGHVHMLIKPEDSQALKEEELPPLTPYVPDAITEGRPQEQPSSEQKKQEDELRDSKSLRKYPATVIAEEIDYVYKKGSRAADIKGSPQARQELPSGRWRMVWFYEGFYNGETDRLKMVSRENQKDVRMRNSLGDDMRAFNATVSTKKDEDYLYSEGLEGVASVDNDEVPQKTGSGGKSGGGGSGLSGSVGNGI